MKKIVATVMHCDRPNRNGRIYSSEMMQKQIDEYNKNEYKLGILSKGDGMSDFETKLVEVSHRIDNVYMNNNTIYMEGKILDTPNGNLVQSFMDNGIELGCELIGYGEIDNETNEVKNFNLNRIDIIEKDKCAWENSKIIECE